MSLVLTFVLLATVSLTVLSLFSRLRRTDKHVEQRVVSALAGSVASTAADAITLVEVPGLSDRLEQCLRNYSFADSITTLLAAADSKYTLGSFVRLSAGTALACGVFIHFFAPLLVFDVAGVAIGALLPSMALMWKRSRRLAAFTKALPDAIDLMARALRAGHSMSSSIELVGEQAMAPVGGEFLQVFQQQRCGVPLRDALLQMEKRVPSKDLQFLITAILVQKETGGNLTEILARTALVIRERVRIAAEIKVYTAQGRLTGWILGMLPVAMLGIISLINPGYCNVLFHDPIGQKLLYGSGVCIAIGCFVINRIVDIKV
jgi:tight adherence protein B